jgi:tungstate transport system substrate-binding protein
MKRWTIWQAVCLILIVTQLVLVGCVAPVVAPAQPAAAQPQAEPVVRQPGTLLLATTTSTADSGLLTFILPDFEQANHVKVDVVAVGTGQAIEIGRRGDADVLLVHSRGQEDKFVADGQAKERFDVMYNDYIIVGPKDDPAQIAAAQNAAEAFQAISAAGATFVSRGDKSGTNTKELGIWSSAKITPTQEMKWYNAIGQGMGDTLLFAYEKLGYTLSDRGTYLSMKDKLPDLVILLGGDKLEENKDKSLLNPYGVMAVNPDKHPTVNSDLAMKFVNWLVSPETQKKIGSYGVDKFGQPLFYPNSKEYKAAQGQ